MPVCGARTITIGYLDILSSLTISSIPLHTGTLITPQITIDFLTLDDDDGDLSNGTPHSDEIEAGFRAHNMVPGPPPRNDSCAAAIAAGPGMTFGSTIWASNDGSSTCDHSGETPDVWYYYRPVADGTATFEICTAYLNVLSVHTGCPGTLDNEIRCNDDACGSDSRIVLGVTAGE
ncbi:MAG: hypothetical protein ACYTFA_16100, partial [Planctomycetota bacterium]